MSYINSKMEQLKLGCLVILDSYLISLEAMFGYGLLEPLNGR